MGIAVSGGSDSIALLVLAAEYAASRPGIVIEAATVDHGLRPEAAGEARFVAEFCGALGVPHVTLLWERDTTAPAGQAAARRARHALLAEWAHRRELPILALGHTEDDRVETFLMRARQGSGWHGLAGLLQSSPSPVWPEGDELTLVRPLLGFGREALREELRSRGVAWVDDPSNENPRYERVRMRRLIARLSPQTRVQVIRISERLGALRQAAAAEARGLVRHVEVSDAGQASLMLDTLGAAGVEAQRRFVEAMVMAAGGKEGRPRGAALDRLLDQIERRDGLLARGVTLAGAKIRTRGGVFLTFQRAPPRRGGRDGMVHWSRAGRLLQGI